MSAVVDVHCHTFNADDLPVQGFVSRVAFHNVELARSLAALVDRLVQGKAPGYNTDVARLDALLLPPPLSGLGDESIDSALPSSPVPPPRDVEADVEETLAELAATEPMLLSRLDAQMPVTTQEISEEGLREWGAGARRAVRWAVLFGSSRLDVAAYLVKNSGDAVDLYTPMLVDLGMGLYDTPGTTIRQQVELHEKVSRLSMLGRLPGATRARLHPFIGFDPRREVQSRRLHEPQTALELVQEAVERYGVVGVKLYPPMGFRPIGNTATLDMSAELAAEVDKALRRLYEWCLREDVPITAHCNISNGAHDSYQDFSHPDSWRAVLDEFPGLRLNLGHFGGARAQETDDGWPWKIARMVDDVARRRLFADVGNHRIDKTDVLDGYVAMLSRMFSADETRAMQSRLMYGSDWLMLAILPKHEQFLETYRTRYHESFGADATEAFIGGNALRFLGFDDPKNRNNQRLRKRYETYAPHRVPNWLA